MGVWFRHRHYVGSRGSWWRTICKYAVCVVFSSCHPNIFSFKPTQDNCLCSSNSSIVFVGLTLFSTQTVFWSSLGAEWEKRLSLFPLVPTLVISVQGHSSEARLKRGIAVWSLLTCLLGKRPHQYKTLLCVMPRKHQIKLHGLECPCIINPFSKAYSCLLYAQLKLTCRCNFSWQHSKINEIMIWLNTYENTSSTDTLQLLCWCLGIQLVCWSAHFKHI